MSPIMTSLASAAFTETGKYAAMLHEDRLMDENCILMIFLFIIVQTSLHIFITLFVQVPHVLV